MIDSDQHESFGRVFQLVKNRKKNHQPDKLAPSYKKVKSIYPPLKHPKTPQTRMLLTTLMDDDFKILQLCTPIHHGFVYFDSTWPGDLGTEEYEEWS